MTSMRTRLVLALAGAALSAPAAAQIAPPPPGASEKEEEYVPPQRRTQIPADAQQRPQTASPRPGQTGNLQRHTGRNLPDIPHPPLAVTGDDGKVIRLRGDLHRLALRSNPVILQRRVEQIMPILLARRVRIEQMVIDNIDLLVALTQGGMIDGMSINNLDEMGNITEMARPLLPPISLTDELVQADVLTGMMAGFNKKIITDYRNAVQEEIQADKDEIGDMEAMDRFMRFLLRDSLAEVVETWEDLLIESMGSVEAIAQQVGLSGDVTSSFGQVVAGADLTDWAAAFQALPAYTDVFAGLTSEQQQAFLEAVRAARPNPGRPSVRAIDVMHDNKKDMTDTMNLQMRTIDPETGKMLLDDKQPESGG